MEEEKIKENSVLLNRFSKDKIKSQSLEKNIATLKNRSKILTNEISRIRNENSSLLSSNNASKDLRKNVSSIEVLPKINFYKYKSPTKKSPSC